MCFPTVAPLSEIEYSTQSLKNVCGITFACLNIQNIIRKIDDIRILVHGLDMDCLCLNESFLNSSISNGEISVDGYTIHRADRTRVSGKCGGGGLLIYAKNSRKFIGIDGSHIRTPHIESLWLKLYLKNAKCTHVGLVYRPPNGNLDECVNAINEQIETHEISNLDDVVLMGDFNVDVLRP